MKEIYYYEYSDDGGGTWFYGEPSFSLLKCVDNARKISYRWRIQKASFSDSILVTQEAVDRSLDELLILEKLFQ